MLRRWRAAGGTAQTLTCAPLQPTALGAGPCRRRVHVARRGIRLGSMNWLCPDPLTLGCGCHLPGTAGTAHHSPANAAGRHTTAALTGRLGPSAWRARRAAGAAAPAHGAACKHAGWWTSGRSALLAAGAHQQCSLKSTASQQGAPCALRLPVGVRCAPGRPPAPHTHQPPHRPPTGRTACAPPRCVPAPERLQEPRNPSCAPRSAGAGQSRRRTYRWEKRGASEVGER